MSKGRVRSSKKQPNSYSPIALQILKLLGAENIARDVAKTVPCAKSTVNYWKKHFVKIGALRPEQTSNFKTYSLTPYGSKLLTGSEEVREWVKLEDHAVKFEIVEGESQPIDWVKLGEPRNWVKLGVKIGDVRVVKTSRSVIVHPGPIKGFDPDELLVQSGQIVERVKNVLESKFGMMLSSQGTPLHKPIFRFYSKEAEELVEQYGTTTVEDVGSIDSSPPEKEAHEEYFGRNPAVKRLLMPLRVEQISQRQETLEKHLSAHSQSLAELTKKQDDLAESLPNRLEKIASSFAESMQQHLDIIKVFREESEKRSQGVNETLNRLADEIEALNKLLITLLRKRSRRRRPSQPKKKSRWQKLRKRLKI